MLEEKVTNITIVSAFIYNLNSFKNINKYIEDGLNLLQINVQKIIFIEKDIYNNYLSNREFNNTHFIFFEKKDNYLYNYINDLTNNFIVTDNPNKDTIDYLFFMNHKTEWMRLAIENNYFNSDQFIWLDFGIYHIFDNNIDLFNKSIYSLLNKKYDLVRIASIWKYDLMYNNYIHKNICWFFAGGVFGGSKNSILKFADLMKNKCISYIQEYKNFVWEVNIWYLIYNDNKDIFDTYTADHDYSLIINY
jgi:hypothetical protein